MTTHDENTEGTAPGRVIRPNRSDGVTIRENIDIRMNSSADETPEHPNPRGEDEPDGPDMPDIAVPHNKAPPPQRWEFGGPNRSSRHWRRGVRR